MEPAMGADAGDHRSGPSQRLPAYSSIRANAPPPSDHGEASSSSDSSSSSRGRRARSPHDPERKKAAEKKFRHRYLLLQQAYEQRLQALAAQVRHVVAELQGDSTIEYLQQDPLTHEYAGARVAEIIDECFSGEREKYVKLVSDQIAWQTSDLREAQLKIRSLQKREKSVQTKWKLAQNEIGQLRRELERRVQELGDQHRGIARLEDAVRKAENERDECRLELERVRHTSTSLASLQHEYETLQVRSQNEREQERAIHESLKQQLDQLREERQQADTAKLGVERDNQHLRQLLKMAQEKHEELSNSLRQVQAEEYSTRLLRMEHEAVQQRHLNEQLLKENEQLKKKYEEFGVQVELYMEEQSRERSETVKQGENREHKLMEELTQLRAQSADAIKVKQNEMLRLADQVKFRQDLLTKAEQKISVLEERVSGLELSLGEEKLRCAKTVSDLEKEVAHWTAAVENEQERAKNNEAANAHMKQSYEQRLQSMQDALDQQHQHSLKERELEARTKWQNDFVAKQEARIEALKNKYDAALEAQQAELLRSRQVALEAAKSAAEKVEEVKAFHQTQRVDDQEVRRLREEAREAEHRRAEAERVREAISREQQKEMEEKDKRLIELEKRLAERERLEERRRVAEEARAKDKKNDQPSVVVLNVNGSDELDEHEGKIGAQAIAMVKRQKKASKAARTSSRSLENNQDVHTHEELIPIAQHKAELQAREAQVALEAEKRIQKEIHEFQERKERELRNAMVNVRKGIQKLEASLDTEKNDKKRIEEELHHERQAFVALKSELDDMREKKQTLAQRLEEANGHLGRLRDVVKEAQAKVNQSETQLEAVLREKRELDNLVHELKSGSEDMVSVVHDLRKNEAQLVVQIHEFQKVNADLKLELEKTQQEVVLRERRFDETQEMQNHIHADEIKRVSGDLTAQIQSLQHQLLEKSGETKNLLEQVQGGAKSMEQLAAERLGLEQTLELTKSELQKQRKEFNDLARMHKNLNETMSTKIRQEQETTAQVVKQLESMCRSRDRVVSDRADALEMYHARVKQLQSECRELRQATASELKAAWKRIKRETLSHANDIQGLMGKKLEQEKAKWEDALRRERGEWRTSLEMKELEMNALLKGEKVDGETKYAQLANRLEAKSNELRDLEKQSVTQEVRIRELQLTIKRLQEENESRMLEQSHLADKLSSSRIVADREIEAKQQLQLSISRVEDVSQLFLEFVRTVMKEFALDPRKVLTVVDNDPKHPETWKVDTLSNDLGRVLELLQERMTAKEIAAADIASRPVQSELNAAREALLPLVAHGRHEVDDSVSKHLPWYISVVRSVKKQIEEMRHEADQLRKTIIEKTEHVNEVQLSLERLQQSQATLIFEKDTLSHELNIQLQTMQKRREGDLQQQKDDYDRKVDQLQRRYTTEQLKFKEEFESAVEQLNAAVDAEKKAHAKLKQDYMVAHVEHEKQQGELQDRVAKIEKELESARDELAKWKRKAKLSASKSPGTPSRRPSVMFTPSPFRQTDDDASDASFQSMFPVSRRPSSAMSDLSNLMEQSLQDLRKDYETILLGPFQQPSPTPKLLQSPMRRASASSRPSPLRIPMYPSPARKRTSLVPPPKLISTVTSHPRPPQPPTPSAQTPSGPTT